MKCLINFKVTITSGFTESYKVAAKNGRLAKIKALTMFLLDIRSLPNANQDINIKTEIME
jgi:hypothetical protein